MPDDVRVEWGRRLRKAREESGLSARQISEAAGITRAYLYFVEAGKYDASTDVKLRLAAAVNKPANEIFALPEAS